MQAKILQHLSKDPLLKKAIAAVELQEKRPETTVYGSLLRSIISQQLSVKAAATIYGRFVELLGSQTPNPTLVLEKSVEDLRAVGLSKQKAGYMHNIATFAQQNDLEKIDWSTYSDEKIIIFLTEIKGVGVWTVQMILMFTLQRPDVLPTADLGIQQAIQQLYELEETGKALITKMKEIAAPWSPYQTTACLYLWSWKDQ
jgi:DNA-3-methyladenine glycosylase II